MSIVIECEACGKPIQAGTGLFSKKKVKCSCGYMIHVNAERMAQDKCPHCGNDVIYDRKKKESAQCPVCHAKIHSGKETVKINCPACKIELIADKHAKTYTCPQCQSLIDVQGALSKMRSSGKTSVVKWDMGINNIFVYRHPVENFNIGSQLIVSEGQKALFFRNGQGLDVFSPGRHILETQKLPLLDELIKFPTDADLTFDSKVYFIRINRLSVKWGIPEIRLRNPGMNFYVKFALSGTCDLQVIDNNESVRKLVYMIIGSSAQSSSEPVTVGGKEEYTSDYIAEKFSDMIKARLSDMMANIIIKNQINVLDLEISKNAISDLMRKDMNMVFEEYGVEVPPMHFNIVNIRIQNSGEVERWVQQEADRVLRVREQQVLAEEALAERGRIMVEEETEARRRILEAQGASEELKIGAAAEAEAYKLSGFAGVDIYSAQATAEAKEMQEKGYTYGMETTRQIGLEAMQNGLPGTGDSKGGGAGVLGDIVGLGVGLGAVGEVVNLTKGIMSPVLGGVQNSVNSNHITEQGVSKRTDTWDCLCGTKSVSSNFCPECGTPKPKIDAWNCSCGCSNIQSKFCPDCGNKRPESEMWNCDSCGMNNIKSKFCPECGHQRGE